MVDVAKWGRGRFYYTEDSQTIPRIFTLETQLASKASLIEQPFKPQLTAPGPRGDAGDRLEGRRRRWAATWRPRSSRTAELVLMSHQEDPILATWRFGLGRSAAFTSDAKAKWGVLWLRWRDFNKFWAQLTRWTLRSGTRSDTTATVRAARTTWARWWWTPIDAKGEFINFLDSQVGVVAPNRQRTVDRSRADRPGPVPRPLPGRRRKASTWSAWPSGEPTQMVGSQLAGLVVPYGQEFRDLGVDEAFLRELSELTGGGMLTEPKDAFLQNRHRSRLSVDMWPWLVGLVAVCWFRRSRCGGSGRRGRADAGVVQAARVAVEREGPDMTAQRRR